MQPSPQLRRPAEDRKIGGVLAGVATFYGIDVSLLRILVVILALCYGTGVLAYLIAWAIIPGE
jgi:phage shock protein C